MRKPGYKNAYHDGKVHLCSRECSTCIFSEGKFHLRPGALREMVRGSLKKDAPIICHATLGTSHPAVCRGFYDRFKTQIVPLRLAQAFDIIQEIEPPEV